MDLCKYQDGTDFIIHSIENGLPVSFLKFGDGEYLAANQIGHQNCDRDTYTAKLGESLINSFRYQVHHNPTCFLGAWHTSDVVNYWERLVDGKRVPWVDFHTLLFDHFDKSYEETLKRVELFKKIKESRRKKIYLCNELLIKSKILLNIDHLLHIPLNNWFDEQFEKIVDEICQLIGPEDGDHIVMTSAGMGSKVLLTELYKRYPRGIYLDIGSGLDFICTQKHSRRRGLPGEYDYILYLFQQKGMIPDNWNSPEYDFIYPLAREKMGVHLR